jgi:RecA-family ATPase
MADEKWTEGDVAELEAATGRKIPRLRDARRPMRWTELEGREPPARTWYISHWLSSGTTLLAGRGGIGKTLLAQTIATALAMGRNFLDVVDAPKRVLFWACEDDHDELWRRQIAICRYLGTSLSDLEGRLMIEPRLGLDNTLFYAEYGAARWTQSFSELKAQVNDYASDVTIIDNIGQTFGGKESDRHHVTAFVNGITGLATQRPHATILLAHPGKQEDSEFSGSTAWENSVRMRWYMGTKLPDQTDAEEGTDDDADVRYIAKRKTNYTVKDYRKLTFRDGVFAADGAAAGSFGTRFDAGRRDAIAEAVLLKGLDQLAVAQIFASDSRTSPDYLPKKLLQMKLAEDCQKKELADALNRLRLAGRLVEGPVGKRANRQIKYGLMRPPS